MTLSALTRSAFALALAVTLAGTAAHKAAFAAGTDDPPAPSGDKDKAGDKDKKDKKDSKAIDTRTQQLAYENFLRDYRAARQLIVTGHYKDGIVAMHAIGHDEHPDVANYIGYAYRHLGDYDKSKVWYEAALKADPNHVRTWSYFGMWQMEQGNRLKALDHLQKVSAICGNTTCEEYRMLDEVIAGKASY